MADTSGQSPSARSAADIRQCGVVAVAGCTTGAPTLLKPPVLGNAFDGIILEVSCRQACSSRSRSTQRAGVVKRDSERATKITWAHRDALGPNLAAGAARPLE